MILTYTVHSQGYTLVPLNHITQVKSMPSRYSLRLYYLEATPTTCTVASQGYALTILTYSLRHEGYILMVVTYWWWT